MRSRNLTLDTLLDDANFPPVFYPEFSEKLIECAFREKYDRFCRLLEKAEKVLLPNDYEFEVKNVVFALKQTGETEVGDWVLSSLKNFQSWKERKDYNY